MRTLCLLLISAATLFSQTLPPPQSVEARLQEVPLHLLNRCTEERRLAAIIKQGGDPTSELVVIDALRFLKNTQNKDGSWCPTKKVSMTAFALLCFLGNGESAQSEEFGVHVLNGIQYLVDVAVKNKGQLASDLRSNKWTYEHAIATLALSEAYTLCEKSFGEKIPNLKRAVEVAGQLIIDSQHNSGGWDYYYTKDNQRGGDVSQTTWHLLALKSCHLTGLEFKSLIQTTKKGLDFIEGRQLSSGAIGYHGPRLNAGQDGTTLAALGGLCFQTWKNRTSHVARKTVRFIDKEMKFDWDTADSDLYGHLFASQLMINHGGKEWARYHQLVFPQTLKKQAPDGSFLDVNTNDEHPIKAVGFLFKGPDSGRLHYRTCLATLILQTYYRNLILGPVTR